MLDLGCAEGYVGQSIHRRRGARVTLADVTDMNRCDLPFELVASDRLPWKDGRFSHVILYFVLHHVQSSHSVLREALRVCRSRVIVVESVYESRFGLQLLTFLDKTANRLRSLGKMNAQEEHLRFRRVEEWEALFKQLDARVVVREQRGIGPFRQALFVLQP